jgi:PTH1 family peptidyl-tRNA hydrolase
MKLIVGLGNPGERYAGTRHNLGAMVLFQLARELNLELSHSSMQSKWGRSRHQADECILAFPQTYMNLSGQAVQALVRYFKIPLEHIIIITDDLNLPVGRLRFRAEGSAGGHNGLKSIIENLGTLQFARLRLGVGQTPPGWDTADYVLSKFSTEELDAVADGVKKAAEAVRCWLIEGLPSAMRTYNG